MMRRPPTSALFPDTTLFRSRWGQLGWETGALGYPVSDTFCGLRDGGCGQFFQGAALYRPVGSGQHPVWGAIGSLWAASGWETGPLGLPTGDVVCGLRGGGCYQLFDG